MPRRIIENNRVTPSLLVGDFAFMAVKNIQFFFRKTDLQVQSIKQFLTVNLFLGWAFTDFMNEGYKIVNSPLSMCEVRRQPDETKISKNRKDYGSRYSTGLFFILPIIFAIMLIGNVLLIAIKLFRVLRFRDLLVGSLAGIDLLNDIGLVLMSVIIFQIDRNVFKSLNIKCAFCHFCNWISSFLRLSSS